MITEEFINKCINPYLTSEEAIEIAMNMNYDIMTPLELAYIQINQKLCIMDFSRFHSAMEKVLDRPIFTHEFGMLAIVNQMRNEVNHKWSMRNMVETNTS